MKKSKPKGTLGSFNPDKLLHPKIKPARKHHNFNSKRALKQIQKLSEPKRSLLERVFPKRSGFWWKSESNGVFGPGSRTRWEFKTGNLALLIAIISLILIIGYIIFNTI